MADLPKALKTKMDASNDHIKFIMENLEEDIEAARVRWDKMVSLERSIKKMREENIAKRLKKATADQRCNLPASHLVFTHLPVFVSSFKT